MPGDLQQWYYSSVVRRQAEKVNHPSGGGAVADQKAGMEVYEHLEDQ
jgi:hypothetical protein